MNENKASIALSEAPDVVTHDGGLPSLPPWLFQHRELVRDFSKASKVSREKVINIINHAHFTDKNLFVCFSHNTYEKGILLKILPSPCLENAVVFKWLYPCFETFDIGEFRFQYIIIPTEVSIVIVPSIVHSFDNEKIKIILPEISYLLEQRKVVRHNCNEITGEIIQNGVMLQGILEDFSPSGLKLKISTDPYTDSKLFNPRQPVFLHLRKGSQILFSGSCKCLRKEAGLKGRAIILAPLNTSIQRFERNEYRNRRYKFRSPLLIHFQHPFYNKLVHREVMDISTSGFAVWEEKGATVLLPGLIIPNLRISYAALLDIECKAQVIYSRTISDTNVSSGINIIDMTIDAYTKLSQLLSQTQDHHAFISNTVDIESLWEFFFDTGFIYPQKYSHMEGRKALFKETIQRLYVEHPEIARHFTYEKQGKIFGHLSMIRAYERTWLIHHHAARAMEGKLSGFVILKNLFNYLYDVCRLPSSCMDYLMCFFKPENKFTKRFYYDFALSLNNPRICSCDLFSYHCMQCHDDMLPANWTIRECSTMDMWKLEQYYLHRSGGLLLNVIGFGQPLPREASIKDQYSKYGLLRDWKAYAIYWKDHLKAVLIYDRSDIGINMSEFLNSIKIIIIEPDDFPWAVLRTAVSEICKGNDREVTLYIYPDTYADNNNIPYEKKYFVWIYDVQYGHEYRQFIRKQFGNKFIAEAKNDSNG